MLKKFRDINLMQIDGNTITIACDSCAGVGALEHDIIKADGYLTGYLTAFVPLAETIAIGARPVVIVNTLSVSKDSYGMSIIDGIKGAALDARLNGEDVVTGSTEENFVVPVTSLGVTVIGILDEDALPKPIDKECSLYLVGLPSSGKEVIEHLDEILTLDVVAKLKETSEVIDILPVGSKGIEFEVFEMAKYLNASVKFKNNHKIELKKSAGPATCAVIAISSFSKEIFLNLNILITELGTFIPNKFYKKD